MYTCSFSNILYAAFPIENPALIPIGFNVVHAAFWKNKIHVDTQWLGLDKSDNLLDGCYPSNLQDDLQ